MKKSRLIQIIALILCVLIVLPSCQLRKKSETTYDDESEEESTTDDESDPDDSYPTMLVNSLDQFISDGSVFAENAVLPTPTPIPVVQNTLGRTNDDEGYFEGALENACIVDNEYFRFTILNIDTSTGEYIMNMEYENKTDNAFEVRWFHPIVDECLLDDTYFYTDVVEPHTVYSDVTNMSKFFPEFFENSMEPTRISFLLIAAGADPNVKYPAITMASDGMEYNYIPVDLFPQGESAFVYHEADLTDSTILFDSDGALFAVDYFEVTDYGFYIHYTFVNKTTEHLRLSLDNDILKLDNIVFDTGSQERFIPPYTNFTSYYYVKCETIRASGLDPNDLQTASIPLLVDSLMNGIYVMWQNTLPTKIVYG